jgi:acyl carrier protein
MTTKAHSLGGQQLDVSATVRAILADTLKRPVEEIALDAKLESGLGIDSMAMIDISVSIEEYFEIALPFAMADEVLVETVVDLVRFVEEQLAQPHRRRGN